MSIIGGESFFALLETYRVLTFEGRYGGGKSALSFYSAYHLLKSGRFRYLFSNVRSVWSDNPNEAVLRPNAEGEPTFLDAVIVLDEAGLFLQYSEDAKEFLAFLRKGNIVILCPSVEEVARSLRGVTVQRLLNLEIIGVPVWVYGYRVRRGMQKDYSRFYWLHPSEIFGIYDSGGAPVDDAGIGDLLQDWKDILAEREKEKQKKEGLQYVRRSRRTKGSSPAIEGVQFRSPEFVSALGGSRGEFGREVGRLEEVLTAIQDANDDTQALLEQRKKRRG